MGNADLTPLEALKVELTDEDLPAWRNRTSQILSLDTIDVGPRKLLYILNKLWFPSYKYVLSNMTSTSYLYPSTPLYPTGLVKRNRGDETNSSALDQLKRDGTQHPSRVG